MKPISIEEIDRNLRICGVSNRENLTFYDVRQEPFRVYGLYDYRNQPAFVRMPEEAAGAVSDQVLQLSRNTAGGRVRFSTDSEVIVLHAVMPCVCLMPHMAMTGSAGFDLYVDDPDTGISRYWRTFVPPTNMKDGYESEIRFLSRKMRSLTIHFPLYSNVKTLLIGLERDAAAGEGLPYRNELTVVCYGSSITQGGCASRPGNCYQNILSRRLQLDFLDLGFSGNGRAEDRMLDYLAELPMSAFLSDYDHNAPDAEHLRKTHYRLYEAVRRTHPEIPYIMLSRYDFDSHYEENITRRDVIYETYRRARAAGDRNVYYIDGASVFRGRYQEMCTVDGTHPNDLGFALLADAIEAELRVALTQNLLLK